MKFKKLENYINSENTYIVYDENTKNSIVIDPGYSAEKIIKAVNDEKLDIKYIFITHCHYDHIAYMEQLREMTGAMLVSGDKAAVNITNPEINLSESGLGYALRAKKSDIVLSDGEEFDLDSMRIRCIYTPGHTDCSVCYLIGNSLFAGDTLFLRSCGRWDLPTGDHRMLADSILNKLYTLDDDTEVYPGHGGKTSIGYEKKFNLVIPIEQ